MLNMWYHTGEQPYILVLKIQLRKVNHSVKGTEIKECNIKKNEK